MKKKALLLLLSVLTLIVVFTATSPTDAPALLLVVPFVALFALLFVGLLFLFEHKGWPPARRFRGAVVGAGVPVVLLVLQSIGQLTVRDIFTIAAIFVILYFYLSRLSFGK